MKKLIVLLAVVMLLLTAGLANAAGTVTQTLTKVGSHTLLLTFSWTADASAATVPVTASSTGLEGYVYLVVTNPGTTAPTDLYDITLTDTESVDVMGGELSDRSTSATQQVVPKIDTVFGARWVDGVLTMTLTNNSVNSATGTVKVYIFTDDEARL